MLEFRFKPAGNAPDSTDHVNGVVPPVVASVCEYAAPTVAPGNVEVVIDSVAETVIDKALVVEAPAASANCTVKFAVAATDGVPVMAPVLLDKLMPGGSAPAEMDQTSGAVPPLEARVWE